MWELILLLVLTLVSLSHIVLYAQLDFSKNGGTGLFINSHTTSQYSLKFFLVLFKKHAFFIFLYLFYICLNLTLAASSLVYSYEKLLVLILLNLFFFLAYFDTLFFLIPTKLLYLLTSFGLIFNLLVFLFYKGEGSVMLSTDILSNIVGSLSIYFIIKLVILFTDKKGIGEGDADLFLISGLFLGMLGNLYIFVLSSIVGTIFALVGIFFLKFNRKSVLPFVPFYFLGFGLLILLSLG